MTHLIISCRNVTTLLVLCPQCSGVLNQLYAVSNHRYAVTISENLHPSPQLHKASNFRMLVLPLAEAVHIVQTWKPVDAVCVPWILSNLKRLSLSTTRPWSHIYLSPCSVRWEFLPIPPISTNPITGKTKHQPNSSCRYHNTGPGSTRQITYCVTRNPESRSVT